MTRTEIEHCALNLPSKERAALAQTLLASLESDRQTAGNHAVKAISKEEPVAFGKRLSIDIERWFEGPFEAMTEDDWQRIFSGERTQEELDRPLGLGVPPEWSERTLRELREATKRS